MPHYQRGWAKCGHTESLRNASDTVVIQKFVAGSGGGKNSLLGTFKVARLSVGLAFSFVCFCYGHDLLLSLCQGSLLEMPYDVPGIEPRSYTCKADVPITQSLAEFIGIKFYMGPER